VLDSIGLGAKADHGVDRLSHGERRALEVGMTLASRPRLILLDEPMAGMGPDESARMEALVAASAATSTVLLIEHDVDVVFRLADRVSVLVGGRVIATGAPAAIRRRCRRDRGVSRRGAALMAGALLAVRGLHAGYGASEVLFGVDLDVGAGAIVGVLGRNGMGKTTLVRSLMGQLRPSAGASNSTATRSPAGRRTASRGAASHSSPRAGRSSQPERRRAPERVRAARANGASEWTPARVLALFPALQQRLRHSGSQLSGGEQQMLAIGRALVTNPRLLLLDEATEGLAPLVREHIWRALAELRGAGLAMIVIDKYVERLIAIADHHVIVEKGRVAWRGSSAELAADRSLWHRHLGA
jgi:branched-chain amino acid transport system ATP-binding protein